MNKDTLINIRVNKSLKEAFQSIIEQDGYTMSDIMEATMKDIVKRGFIPINLRSKLPPSKSIIVPIPSIKTAIENIIAGMDYKDKIKTISLFGSYSRGMATPKSDIDILLETERGFSIFDLGDLQNKLEKTLGKKVDIATNTGDEYFMNHISKEKIQLYSR